MSPEPHRYRGYDIRIIEDPPVWQAAIYPTQEQLLRVDWALDPISSNDMQAALVEARQRIDFALAGPQKRTSPLSTRQ
jgi:hypothetical protein